MTYGDAIRDGIRIVNRNWQLVLLQLGMVFISSIGLIIIVGIPLAIAFIIFGVDLTEMADVRDILKLIRGSSEMVSKYLGLLLAVLACVLLYLLFVILLGMYVFSGSVGIIGRSIRDSEARFHLRTFFEEARKHFFRLLAFTSLIGVVFIVVAFVLGILGGGIAALVSYAKSQDSPLVLFFGAFFSLTLLIIGAILILGILATTLYGVALVSFRETGPLKSFQGAWQFLLAHPHAFWLYVILFFGYLIASFLVVLFSYPFSLIPIVGGFFSFPYQLISSAFETYLGLIIIATTLNYYFVTEIRTEAPAPPAPEPGDAPSVVEHPGDEPPSESAGEEEKR